MEEKQKHKMVRFVLDKDMTEKQYIIIKHRAIDSGKSISQVICDFLNERGFWDLPI